MKVTKELREVIEKSLNDQKRNATAEYDKAIAAEREKDTNVVRVYLHELKKTEEGGNFVAALQRTMYDDFQRVVNRLSDVWPNAEVERLKKERSEVGTKYAESLNGILIRLSYSTDLEAIREVLAQYNITI
jgi:hypothetical protein